MDKESIYLLQQIDCNCNDCIFMVRDLEKFKKWEAWHRQIELTEFERAKSKALADAANVEDERERNAMLRIAEKMKFQFSNKWLIQYGDCTKFKKPVSFLPNICQLETQTCFQHRKQLPT